MTLRLLTWEGYAPQKKTEHFIKYIKKKYNRDLIFEVDYVSSSDDYFNKIRSNKVDIIAPSHNIINDPRYNLLKHKFIIPLNIVNIPNFSSIDNKLISVGRKHKEDETYFVPMVYGPYGLIYNKTKIKEEPRSWKVLWEKESKNKYTINKDYYEVNIYITALAAGFSFNEVTNVNKLHNPIIQRMLNKLVSNSSPLWSGVDTVNTIKNNDLATSWGFSLNELNSHGKDWHMSCPREGTSVWIDGHSITRELKNKPLLKLIAEEWINFTISKAFQLDVVYGELGSIPSNNHIKDQLLSMNKIPKHYTCINLDLAWPVLNTRQRNYMSLLWNKALKSRLTNN
jgi:spermidine/putrescine transport system substrate-binding protein